MTDRQQVDHEQIAKLEANLLTGGGEDLARYFQSINAPSPITRWSPSIEDLDEEVLRILLAYWQRMPKGLHLPLADGLDPLELGGALGLIMLLEVLDGGYDFRYRVYGSEIARRSGFDATGKCVSEIPVAPMSAYFMAGYRACLSRQEPLFTRHVPPVQIHVVSWDRIILPLEDGQGTVSRLLVGNVPGSWR